MSLSPHEELLHLLYERSYQRRKVILASGRESDFYVDGKQTTLHARGAALVGRLVLDRIRASELDIVGVGGLTLGADPIVTATSLLSSQDEGPPVHGFIVRKEAKGHGTAAWLEGMSNLPPGATVCIVEDTSTTGGSAWKAIERTVEAGYTVGLVISVVDRQEGAAEFMADKGYTLLSLIDRSELEALSAQA